MTGPRRTTITRRRVLAGGLGALVGGLAMPAFSRANARPLITHGLQCGDVSRDRVVLWTRTDRAARVHFDVAATNTFQTILRSVSVDAGPEADFTAKALVDGLPPGQQLFWRARTDSLVDENSPGEPLVGSFRTAPDTRQDVSFVWSGDTAGQGWGIDEARGGMTMYRTMLGHRPDFFIHCGDMIYADALIPAEKTLPDGSLWRNLVTPEKSKVAETLAEFRGNYKYNLLDRNLLSFNTEVPMLAQWDDHEVTNNWWPTRLMDDERYREKSVAAMAVHARQAFYEFVPISAPAGGPPRIDRKIAYGPLLDVFLIDLRSYRAANTDNLQTSESAETALMGERQRAWLMQELAASRAVWKVIASDMPIGVVVYDDYKKKTGADSFAQGDPGAARGRELELAGLLSFIKRRKIANVVWLTADVHYTAAHYYDPAKAYFQDFDPFWEFVSGPLQAGTFGPGDLDGTFGPQQMFAKAPSPGQGQNLPPSEGLQFFGHVTIAGESARMTVTLRDVADAALWRITLDPKQI